MAELYAGTSSGVQSTTGNFIKGKLEFSNSSPTSSYFSFQSDDLKGKSVVSVYLYNSKYNFNVSLKAFDGIPSGFLTETGTSVYCTFNSSEGIIRGEASFLIYSTRYYIEGLLVVYYE